MAAPFKVTFVISTNCVGPRMRPAFNERFDAVTAWLRNHGTVKARIMFAAKEAHVSPFQSLELTTPADQLVIPNLGDDVEGGLRKSMSGKSSPRRRIPNLFVVLSTLVAAESDDIEILVGRDPSENVLGYYLFVVGQDTAGRSNGTFASDLAERHSHVAAVQPTDDVSSIGSSLNRLLAEAERDR